MDSLIPKFSLVIPTLRRPDTLRHSLATLTAQTYDDFEIVVAFENMPQPLAHQGVVVGEQNADGHQTGTSVSGMRRVMRVPRPGAESITSVPPAMEARSRIPRSPRPVLRAGMP